MVGMVYLDSRRTSHLTKVTFQLCALGECARQGYSVQAFCPHNVNQIALLLPEGLDDEYRGAVHVPDMTVMHLTVNAADDGRLLREGMYLLRGHYLFSIREVGLHLLDQEGKPLSPLDDALRLSTDPYRLAERMTEKPQEAGPC